MRHAAPPVPRTNPGMPDDPVPGRTQFGEGLTHEQWHRLEADRWARTGRFAFVRSNGGGRIYLFEGNPLPDDSIHYMPSLNGSEVTR